MSRLVFRCDGNPSIGAGHVMRCLSIAAAAKEQGYACTFILASDDFRERVEAAGHEAIILHSDYRDMQGELPVLEQKLQNEEVSAVFVDSYFPTEEYMRALSEICHAANTALIYIDDLCAKPLVCDILIDYNIYGEKKQADYEALYAKGARPVFLIGSYYAPLRREFSNRPDRKLVDTAREVMVSTGGADGEHMTLALVKALQENPALLDFLTFHFVIGQLNGDYDEIAKLTSGRKGIVLHRNVADMAGLMAKCDIAVSAAGSTLYELCALQTPTITYVLADNQVEGAEEFCHRGVMEYAGDIRSSGKEQLAAEICKRVLSLSKDEDKRAAYATQAASVVDGHGAARIVSFVADFNL